MKVLNFIILYLTSCFLAGQHISNNKCSIDTLSATYRTENSFKGIVEAFSKREFKGGRYILRTNEKTRSGFYLTLKFNHSLALIPAHSKIRISFITQHALQETTFEWEIPEIKHSFILQNELILGITGPSQFSSQTKIISWQADLLSPQGMLLATKKSFAW